MNSRVGLCVCVLRQNVSAPHSAPEPNSSTSPLSEPFLICTKLKSSFLSDKIVNLFVEKKKRFLCRVASFRRKG